MRYRVFLFIVPLSACYLFFLSASGSSTTLAENRPELIAELVSTGTQNHYYTNPNRVDPNNQTSYGSDDAFEENDTSDTAKMLLPGLYAQLTSLDDDWYEIKLEEKATLTIAVEFSHADGNIDMQLFQSGGSTRIAESTSTTDNEYIRIPDLNAGNYLLRIYAPQNIPNDYGLVIVFNDASLVQIENTDNDWYLPPGVKRDSDSGFFRFSLRNPSPEFPILSSGGETWSWKTLNPAEGVYRFDLIQAKIDQLRETPYVVGMRVLCGERDKIPDWVVYKHNPPIVTFTGGRYDVEYVSPWHPGVEAEFLKFLKALGQTGIPQNPKVVFAYIHGISSSRGEELGLKSVDEAKAEQIFGLTPEVYRNWAVKRIDAWADAFEGVEYKLMWVGKEDSLGYYQESSDIVTHVLNRGASFRGGYIEAYYDRIYPQSTGQGLARDPYGLTSPYYETYFYTDLDFPGIAQRRARGDENEAYWSGSWGDTLEQSRHRWLMSNLRALTLNLRFLYTGEYAYNLNPPFSSYVQKSLGKTVDTSRDAWVHLNEGYRRYYIDGGWRDVAMKNFERYLYQRDLPGARTVAVERVYRNKAGGDSLRNPPWGTGTPFDLVARRTDRATGNDRMNFNVEDRFIHTEPQMVLLKVTYKDDDYGQWHVEYGAGSDGILSTPSVVGVNDGQWKTATFVLGRATLAGQLLNEQDLAIVADTDDVTVKYVRIIKWSQLVDTEPTATPTLLPTDAPTLTLTPLPTVILTATPTVVPGNTPTPSPTNTPTPTLTPLPTVILTATPTVVPGNTPTSSPTNTPTLTVLPTNTPTVTPTLPPTSIPTPTTTPTNTPLPGYTPTLPSISTPELVQLTIDEPLYAGDTVVTGNAIPGKTVVATVIGDPPIFSEDVANHEGQYAVDLSAALGAHGKHGLDAQQIVQAEMEGQTYRTVVVSRAVTQDKFQIFLPIVSRYNLP